MRKTESKIQYHTSIDTCTTCTITAFTMALTIHGIDPGMLNATILCFRHSNITNDDNHNHYDEYDFLYDLCSVGLTTDDYYKWCKTESDGRYNDYILKKGLRPRSMPAYNPWTDKCGSWLGRCDTKHFTCKCGYLKWCGIHHFREYGLMMAHHCETVCCWCRIPLSQQTIYQCAEPDCNFVFCSKNCQRAHPAKRFVCFHKRWE